ncbi:MAG: hypothetical protein ACE5PO_01170 [Candidatus Bathyarchaeia archaeon]
MREEPKKDKKFIAVRGDLLHKIIEIANKDGKTVFGFVNEIFEQAIRSEQLNVSLEEIIEFYELIEIMKKAGAVITTADLQNHLVGKLYSIEKDSLREKWYVSGVWYGKYLATRFNDALGVFKRILQSCMWDISEANVEVKGDGHVNIRCVAPNHSRENTELLARFLQGVMNALDFKVVKEEAWKGIILMELEKRTPLTDIELGLEPLKD